jgi:hypothetical protein
LLTTLETKLGLVMDLGILKPDWVRDLPTLQRVHINIDASHYLGLKPTEKQVKQLFGVEDLEVTWTELVYVAREWFLAHQMGLNIQKRGTK